jgi:protein-disulfide isomerase
VEFGDFQCPFCGAVEPTILQVDAARPGLRWVWKNMPLNFHPRALPTAIAAMCAHAQGHFWEMHDRLYANQNAQSDGDLANYAVQIGLNVTEWQACLTSTEPVDQISADLQAADSARVDGTPAFFINGLSIVGSQPLGNFLPVIDQALSSAQASGSTPSGYYAAHEGQGCR